MECSRIERALAAGIEFLRGARSDAASAPWASGGESGWWSDFTLYPGASDEWVTAYTGAALAETGDSSALEAAELACRLLQRRAMHRPAGFGYNGSTTSDADSTVWACRLAQNLGLRPEYWEASLTFLRTCMRADGGVSTYPSRAAVRKAVTIPLGIGAAGWASSHVCVTAAAMAVEGIRWDDSVDFLRRRQLQSGAWSGYWWADPEYATALAIESLICRGGGDSRELVNRGAAWINTQQRSDSAFALALRILGLLRASFPAGHLIVPLLELQLPDGSWPASARLRQPAPNLRDPDTCWYWSTTDLGFGCIRLDLNRIFTTATAVRSLNTCLRH